MTPVGLGKNTMMNPSTPQIVLAPGTPAGLAAPVGRVPATPLGLMPGPQQRVPTTPVGAGVVHQMPATPIGASRMPMTPMGAGGGVAGRSAGTGRGVPMTPGTVQNFVPLTPAIY